MAQKSFFYDKSSHFLVFYFFLFFTFWMISFKLDGFDEFYSNDKERKSFENELNKIFIKMKKMKIKDYIRWRKIK